MNVLTREIINHD